jgi:uncharacterized protein with GYD domain
MLSTVVVLWGTRHASGGADPDPAVDGEVSALVLRAAGEVRTVTLVKLPGAAAA